MLINIAPGKGAAAPRANGRHAAAPTDTPLPDDPAQVLPSFSSLLTSAVGTVKRLDGSHELPHAANGETGAGESPQTPHKHKADDRGGPEAAPLAVPPLDVRPTSIAHLAREANHESHLAASAAPQLVPGPDAKGAIARTEADTDLGNSERILSPRPSRAPTRGAPTSILTVGGTGTERQPVQGTQVLDREPATPLSAAQKRLGGLYDLPHPATPRGYPGRSLSLDLPHAANGSATPTAAGHPEESPHGSLAHGAPVATLPVTGKSGQIATSAHGSDTHAVSPESAPLSIGTIALAQRQTDLRPPAPAAQIKHEDVAPIASLAKLDLPAPALHESDGTREPINLPRDANRKIHLATSEQPAAIERPSAGTGLTTEAAGIHGKSEALPQVHPQAGTAQTQDTEARRMEQGPTQVPLRQEQAIGAQSRTLQPPISMALQNGVSRPTQATRQSERAPTAEVLTSARGHLPREANREIKIGPGTLWVRAVGASALSGAQTMRGDQHSHDAPQQGAAHHDAEQHLEPDTPSLGARRRAEGNQIAQTDGTLIPGSPTTGSAHLREAAVVAPRRGEDVATSRLPSPIVEGIVVRHAALHVTPSSSSFRVMLKPETLGAVIIHVERGQAGLQVTLSAQQPDTHKLLHAQLPALISLLRASDGGPVHASMTAQHASNQTTDAGPAVQMSNPGTTTGHGTLADTGAGSQQGSRQPQPEWRAWTPPGGATGNQPSSAPVSGGEPRSAGRARLETISRVDFQA